MKLMCCAACRQTLLFYCAPGMMLKPDRWLLTKHESISVHNESYMAECCSSAEVRCNTFGGFYRSCSLQQCFLDTLVSPAVQKIAHCDVFGLQMSSKSPPQKAPTRILMLRSLSRTRPNHPFALIKVFFNSLHPSRTKFTLTSPDGGNEKAIKSTIFIHLNMTAPRFN